MRFKVRDTNQGAVWRIQRVLCSPFMIILSAMLFSAVQISLANELSDQQNAPLKTVTQVDQKLVDKCTDMSKDGKSKESEDTFKSCFDSYLSASSAKAVVKSEKLNVMVAAFKALIFLRDEITKELRVIGGSNTGLVDVKAAAIDESHKLVFVYDQSLSKILAYDISGQGGNLVPIRFFTLASDVQLKDFVIDESKSEIFVADVNPEHPRVLVYSLKAFDEGRFPENSKLPKREISGTATTLSRPSDLALSQSSGQLFVLEGVSNRILVFNGSSGESAKPLRVIEGPATELDKAVAMEFSEAKQELQVLNGDRKLLRFQVDATGNTAPLKDY